jgi:hypothetical protein
MTDTSNKPKFFDGYTIVLVGFLVTMVSYGTLYSFGVFFKPVLADFNWTKAATSGAYSLYFLLAV